MLLKWIVCSVPAHARESFSAAQAKWEGLASISGFVGQLGGWDLKSENDACILGVWQDQDAYNSFMAEHHDKIFLHNQQAETYQTIKTALLQPVDTMPGAYQDIAECLGMAKAIRIADCRVRSDREEHFIHVQRSNWIPGMQRAAGMLAGSFNKVKADETRYIVVSFWDGLDAHDKYVKDMLPALREAADLVHDVQEMTGRLINVIPDWLVMPKYALRDA